jgi:Tol biopolymer transport system component
MIAPVRIVDSAPADGNDDVPISAPIRLAFSQPMDRTSVEAHLHLEPEVPGRLIWDGQEAIWRPQSALAPSTAYTITLEAGAASQRGQPLGHSYVWSFHTREPQVLYLGKPTPEAEWRQLFVARLDGEPPRQLTDHRQGVWDYTVHPLGDALVYSVLREDGGSDLWWMDRDGASNHLLVACPELACLNPVWAPDGQWLSYEQRGIWADEPNLDPKSGRIWILDLERDKTWPLFEYDVPLHSPVWSPEGQRMAYVSPILPGVEVYDLHTEELLQFGNQWGSTPVWSPDGHSLVMPDLVLVEEMLLVRLIRTDLEDGHMVDISGGDDLVKDTAPAWSPGGGWIAFGRQFLDDERWTPGRQIWLTRPDGSEAYALLSAPMADLFAFAWRPDGAALAYLRADLTEGITPVPEVSVWIYDLLQRRPLFVVEHGVLPKWLP